MSLLHQESPEEIDDAALGEEYTKGSSHVVMASIIATAGGQHCHRHLCDMPGKSRPRQPERS